MASLSFASLGMQPLTPASDPEAYQAFTLVARRIKRHGSRTLGFLPADPTVRAMPILLHLAAVLCQLGCSPISVVVTEPSDTLHDDSDGPVVSRRVLLDEGVSVRDTAPGDPDHLGPLTVTVLREPFPVARALFHRVVAEQRETHAKVFADLTGFERTGEHLEALDELDGVVVLARTHRTTEGRLLEVEEKIPRRSRLGALLIG